MYGYRFDFSAFSEVVLQDGTVIRRMEHSDGARYAITEKVASVDAYVCALQEQGIQDDGREIDGDELAPWLEATGIRDPEIETLKAVMTASEIAEEFGLADATVRQFLNRNEPSWARKSAGTWLALRREAERQWKKKGALE